jgi:hypothetical protein
MACAYCNGSAPMTREHVFPAWLYRETPEYEAQLLRIL